MRTGSLLKTTALYLTTSEGREVVNNLNMQIAEDKVAIIGRNGVGKSTLIRALSAPEKAINISRTEDYFCVYQSLEDNVFDVASCSIDSYFSAFDEKLRYREFAKIGLDESLNQLHFSSGELRKINLVYAKLSQPELLLLDEPTSDLDEQGKRWLLNCLTA
jgi:ABC-type multidrug transport system ATPase subunit